MKRMPTIKSVMTPFPYTIEVDESLAAAREMMGTHEIHHLPVSENGRIIGVISKHDVETALAGEPSTPADEQAVKRCYSSHIYVVGLSKPLDAVLLEMANRHIRSAVVIKGDKLAGIFTVTDACRHYAELLKTQFRPAPEDGGADGGDDQAA
jgi:CBS domain-containing protein